MSQWQSWRWVLEDVVIESVDFGADPRCLMQDDNCQRWLHPGLVVELFKDDAEGYQLNLTTPSPCWFVLYRLDEEATAGEPLLARPAAVSLSYHDAGRWLDAQELVEQVPAPAEVVQWVQAFVDEYYQPEVKRRKRPESFRSLTDRFGSPASISTDKKFGPDGGPGGGGRHG
jgi:hypothetical protein